MKGIFGDMFDLNGSGGLDPAELAGDYALADEVLNEEDEEKRQEAKRVQEIPKAETNTGDKKIEIAHKVPNAMPETCLVGEQVAPVTEKPIASEKKYLYCRVKFASGQSSFYLSDDKTIKPGDFVTALYGRKAEQVLTGEVCDIYECTEENAFHPPQLTRHIIGRSVRPHGWMEPPEPIKERRAAYKRKLKEEVARKRLENGTSKQTEETVGNIVLALVVMFVLLCVPGLGALVIAIAVIVGIISFIYG